MSPTESREGRPWLRAVLGTLAILAALLALTLMVLPLPDYLEPQRAGAVKHPPYPQGKRCNDPSCHDEYTHEQPFDERPCDTCHTLETWADVHFRHEYAEMNLGVHPVLGCAECHEEGYAPPNRACQTCHRKTSPHRQPAYGNCANCHTALGWKFVKVPRGHLSLQGGHEGLECMACHNPVSFSTPGRDCSACHGPKHGYARGCAKCHYPARFWNVDESKISHAFFPFGKAHSRVKCLQCHPALQFVGIIPECAACHGANHGFRSNCTRCHSVYLGGWKVKHFNHDFYPLSGVHAAFECGSCHPSRTVRLRDPNVPQGTYGPLMKASTQIQFVGVRPTCQNCHGVPHGDCLSVNCYECHNTADFNDVDFNHRDVWQFYTGAHTRLACSKCHAGGVKFCSFKGKTCPKCHGLRHGFTSDVCTRCHNTSSWSSIHFNHRKVWPLYTGAHARVGCGACHPGNKFVPAPSDTCSNCHGAPHGQCLSNQGVGCVVCHDTSSWEDVDFDHRDYWVNWTGAHTSLPCSTCHPGGIEFCELQSGQNTNCSAPGCHGGQHGFADNTSNSVCQNCHSTSAFWPLESSFSHPVPLGGFHSQGNVRSDGSSRCNLCHPSYNFVDSPRPCQDCHADDVPHGSCFQTRNCIQCHWPTTWSDLHFTHPQEILDEHPPDVADDCNNCHPGGDFCEDNLTCTPCHSSPPS
ncbi:MAG: hypothetical protein HY876_01615 [Coriobacteriales bacterium]|nr:hypothetical protein [Coriobacteriales bacterium]